LAGVLSFAPSKIFFGSGFLATSFFGRGALALGWISSAYIGGGVDAFGVSKSLVKGYGVAGRLWAPRLN
jgi:hypothetical protein